MDDPSNTLSRRDLIVSLVGLGAAASQTFAAANAASSVSADEAIRPFRIAIPRAKLDDLRRRLALTRWPTREAVNDASQGVPLERMQALVKYWHDRYDWRRVESRLNSYPQFVTRLDGVDIHFLHVRSRHTSAVPLIMTHGWPGSIVEFLKVIDPLVDPTAHGGRVEDAFHLVLPSLPGYGFSGKPTTPGWDRHRIARAWHTLMMRLGYENYFAQGGDWGAVVTQAMGHQAPAGLLGIHINMPAVVPKDLPATLNADEQRALDALKVFFTIGAGYAQIQATRPQTLGYALADSPSGEAAWIYDKFMAWTDSGGNVEHVLSMDEMLDDISLYWLTDSATSSARLYWENADLAFYAVVIDIPVGVTVFPGEIYRAPRTWAKQCYHRLVYWNEAPKGGHFAAFEQPEIFVREVRAAFAAMQAGAKEQ